MKKLFILYTIIGVLLFGGCEKKNDNDDNNDNNTTPSQYFSVLIEDFSHTDCVPCVNVDNAVNTVLEYYASQGASPIFMEFHPKPTGFGDDPFNLANPELHDGRMNWYYDYYGLDNVPQLFVDATVLSATDRNDVDRIQQIVEDAKNSPKPATISGSASLDGDSIRLQVTITADSSITADVFCYLVRETITFTTAPGSNGLEEFHMIPAAQFEWENPTPTASFTELDINSSVDIPDEISGGTTDGYSAIVVVQDNERNILGVARFDIE